MKRYLSFFQIFIIFASIYQHLTLQASQNIVKTINNQIQLNQDKICDGNRFQYMSSFVLGRQNDLTKTFTQIQKNIKLKNITYSQKQAQYFRIQNVTVKLLYLQSKQIAQVKGINVLNISGGYLKVNYQFHWEKQQISGTIKGTGSGTVSTDPISFQKILQTNQTHDLQWKFTKALPITISNSLTLSKFIPFRDYDYIIINKMLNQLPPQKKTPTLKQQLIAALNTNFTNILKVIVKQDQTISIPKQISYTYNDYRGQFNVIFNNLLLSNSLTKSGLSLLLSQVIKDDKYFQCGEKVPDQPESQSLYGGTQQFISNKFFKSTLINALRSHFLDVTLNQETWQSRAFQFFMGDLHQVMSLTKNISSFRSLNGKCQALDDKSFAFNMKSNTTYSVIVNFTCYLLDNVTKMVDLVLPVQYQIMPKLTSKTLDFIVKDIKGTPKFLQTTKYKISNLELANFILTQTLNTAKNCIVIGSGYKTRNRKLPRFQVRERYLFLYDKSTITNKKLEEL